MAETFQEYTDRIESYARGKDRRAVLQRTPRVLGRHVGRASRRRLTTRPKPGKWSAGEILAHMSEVELLWGYRIRALLEKSGVRLLGMDQNVWARNSRYRDLDPRHAYEAFAALRRANLRLIGRMRGKTLSRWGAHSQFGRLTIDRIVTLMVGHDINHTRQIETLLAPKRKKGRTKTGRSLEQR
jgi:uncharacterized damage-inducible protein DinB